MSKSLFARKKDSIDDKRDKMEDFYNKFISGNKNKEKFISEYWKITVIEKQMLFNDFLKNNDQDYLKEIKSKRIDFSHQIEMAAYDCMSDKQIKDLLNSGYFNRKDSLHIIMDKETLVNHLKVRVNMID